MIERRAPALDAGGDLRGQRAVAVVAQAAARDGDRRREIGAAGRHRRRGSRRRRSRGRRDHGVIGSGIGRRRVEADGRRGTRARVIGRLPSAWISVRSKTPVAGRHDAADRRRPRRSCPAAARPAASAGPTVERSRISRRPSMKRERVRPGMQPANQVVDAVGRPAPVDDAVVLGEPMRVGGRGIVLRRLVDAARRQRRRASRPAAAAPSRPGRARPRRWCRPARSGGAPSPASARRRAP